MDIPNEMNLLLPLPLGRDLEGYSGLVNPAEQVRFCAGFWTPAITRV
jgi:hypothetical protein